MRLLLIEDDLELADGLRNTLAQSGYAADAAHTGRDALSAYAANTSNVEVFVSRPRRKLSEASAHAGIRVFRGMGYRLEHKAAEGETA